MATPNKTVQKTIDSRKVTLSPHGQELATALARIDELEERYNTLERQYDEVLKLLNSYTSAPTSNATPEATTPTSSPTITPEAYTATIDFSASLIPAPLSLEDAVKGSYLILDTETTGLSSDAEICQIAIINQNGETLLNTLVKPKKPIGLDAERIHGISNKAVENAPTFPEILDLLKIMLTGSQVLVYNATFDRGMLHKSAEAWGLPKTEWKELANWNCVMLAFSEIYGEWNSYHGNYKWQRLSTAASYYGVKVENAHDALGDCLMTLGVVKAMYKTDGE